MNGELPGHVFSGLDGQSLDLKISATLSTQDPVSAIEIVKNGRVERAVPIAEWKNGGTLATLTFVESGWFLVRAIADNPKTFRFASTAPYYVEIGKTKRRISKASAQFFLDWVRERAQRVKLEDADQRREVLKPHERAERFWADVVSRANSQ